MGKRARFILISVILSMLLWATQFIAAESRLQAVIAVAVMAYILSAWSLFEDLKGVEWLTILSLPVLYTLGAGLFSFFLPTNVPRLLGINLGLDTGQLVAGVVRLLFWGGFGLGYYAISLTENIFSVAAIRTIQLLRAAHAVGFLLTLITGLFFFHSIYSFRLPFWMIALAAAGVAFLLFLQGNWSVQLKEGLGRRVLLTSAISALIVGQIAAVLAFWPIEPLTAALSLVSAVYVMLGLSQQSLVGRLFKNQITEYVVVAVVVMLASIYITTWR
jgi:hypothetical protein